MSRSTGRVRLGVGVRIGRCVRRTGPSAAWCRPFPRRGPSALVAARHCFFFFTVVPCGYRGLRTGSPQPLTTKEPGPVTRNQPQGHFCPTPAPDPRHDLTSRPVLPVQPRCLIVHTKPKPILIQAHSWNGILVDARHAGGTCQKTNSPFGGVLGTFVLLMQNFLQFPRACCGASSRSD